MNKQPITEIVQGLVDFTNNMSLDYREEGQKFAETLYHNHRTLQQSTIRLLASAIAEYTKLCKEHGTDLRNQAAYEWTDRVTTIEAAFPFV